MTEISEDPKTLPPIGVPRHLRDAFHAAHQNHLTSVDTLRSAVCEYVDEMRGGGLSYDDIVRAVHNLVAQHYRDAQRSPDAMKDNARLVDTMIQWCKDHWHRTP